MRPLTLKKLTIAAAFGTALAAASPVSAQLSTTANGPYYATPSWDQKLTTNRFVILANWDNRAVLDRETGLVWRRTPHPGGIFLKRTWFQASIDCLRFIDNDGRWGWRLPSIQELLSLKQLPAGHPFIDVQPDYYWSATTAAVDTSTAWVGAPLGGGPVRDDKNAGYYVWCVRGGPGPDVQ